MRARDLTKGTVAYHSELNPAAWDNNELRPEVRYKLLEIAQRFIEYLEVPNFKLLDVILRGSLVNYNYTAYSDFDLHIVTDYATLECDITEQYYMAKKKIWNDEHDITIRGHEVELYVEDRDEQNISAGTYSVLDNKWLKTPKYDPPTIDQTAVNTKARDLMTQINRAVRSGDVEEMNHLKDKIKTMRQAGLDREGEFSTENLAFKILRNKKSIEKLYKAIQRSVDQELSLDEALQLAEQGPWHVMEDAGPVQVRASSLLDDSLSNKPADIAERLRDFIEFKKANPLAQYGKKDTSFNPEGLFGRAIPKLRHAHLNLDISVFYTIEGRDPIQLKIYGVFRHKESGTAQADNKQVQKQLVKRLKQADV